MGIYKIEQKRPEDSPFANNLTSFRLVKKNQLLSQLTHAHHRDTVPLNKRKVNCWVTQANKEY